MLKGLRDILNKVKFDADFGLNDRIQNLPDRDLLDIVRNPYGYRRKTIDCAQIEAEKRGISNVVFKTGKSKFDEQKDLIRGLKANYVASIILIVLIALTVAGFIYEINYGLLLSLIGLCFLLYKRVQLANRKARAVVFLRREEVPRSTVLYLRSFKDDNTASRMVGWSTEEEHIASVFQEVAPFVTVGLSKSELPETGAARFYLGEKWKDEVLELIDEAIILVLRIGEGEGFLWEAEQVFRGKVISLERIVLLVPYDTKGYERFREHLERLAQITLPPSPTGHMVGSIIGYIYFLKDCTPVYMPFRRLPGTGGLRELPDARRNFKYSFKPFFDQIGIEQP